MAACRVRIARLRSWAEAAREQASQGALRAVPEPDVAEDVLALLDALEAQERALERVRGVCMYPKALQSGGLPGVRFVLNGSEVLRAIAKEIP